MAMQNPILSIIIVNYNVKDFLHQTLNSIQKAIAGIHAEILVVDNASHDGSIAMVRENFPQVQLLVNRTNRGFASANNQALARAQGEFIVLINPDTLVQEDTFVTLLDFFNRQADAGLAGCKILNPDGSLQLACRRSIPTPWVAFTKLIGLSLLFPRQRLFGRYNLTYLDPDLTVAVDAISGSFMMVRRKVIDQVGLLDERFFMYGEDLDWCYRIRQAGWQIYYVPLTKIIHYKGASSQKARFDTLLLFYRAMLLFVRKHFQKRYLFLPQWFLIIGIGIRAVLSFLHSLFIRWKWQLLDLVVLNLSLLLALLIRFSSLTYWRSYLVVTAIYSVVWLICFYFFGLYERRKFVIASAAAGVVFGLVINSTITYFAKNFAFSRLVVLLAGGLNLFFIPGWRWLLGKMVAVGRWQFLTRARKRYFRKEAIVVGNAASAANLLQKLQRQFGSATEVVGILLTDATNHAAVDFAGIPVFTELSDLPWYVEDLEANEVIFNSDAMPYEKMLGLISQSQKLGVDFKIASQNMEVIFGSSSVDYLGDISLVGIEYRLGRAPFRLLKRLVDVVISFILLLPAIPIWLILWLRGNHLRRLPFYTRLGTGVWNNLHYGNDQNDLVPPSPAKVWVFTKDKQTPHSFWQRTPLLLKVLQGKVSLVGTEIQFQSVEMKNQTGQIRLKPGLTSPAQAPLAEDRYQNWEKNELFYLKNYTPWLDLEIIFKALTKR